MNSLPTLKMLLLALILADLGFSSAIAQSSRPAYGVATTAQKSSASKSTHSLRRKHHRHHRRVVRKSRVHHQRHQQRGHKSAASQPKSRTQL